MAFALVSPPAHTGFPITLAGTGTVNFSQPLIADLGLSGGTKSIIFGTVNGGLHVLCFNVSTNSCHAGAAGTWGERTGFPVFPGTPLHSASYIASSPAVGLLDNDASPDIVVGYGNPGSSGPGGVAAYTNSGTLIWDHPSLDNAGVGGPDPVFSTPAIGDVDGDGKNEVVYGSFDEFIYVLNGTTGAPKGNWPLFVRDSVWSSPALWDLDGDGKLDIIIGVDAHLEGAPFSTPDGGCLHVFRFDATQPHISRGTGLPDSNPETWGPPTELSNAWPKCVDQIIQSSPVVGDIDGDGKPEIVHGTGQAFYPARQQKLYAWHCDGTVVSGWGTQGNPGRAVPNGGYVVSSPALADLDGDGVVDVVIGSDNSGPATAFHVSAIKGNGTLLWSSVPIDVQGNTNGTSTPIVADVMGDGNLDVLVTTNTSVVVFDKTGAQLTATTLASPSFNFYTETALAGVAAGALGTDNSKIEVVAVTGSPFPTPTDAKVYVWNPKIGSSSPPWGQFHGDAKRTGAAPGAGSCYGACSVANTARNFFSITPCRVADTRNANGPTGGPVLLAGALRDFTLRGVCGVPNTATAVSVNVTVVSPSSAGLVRFSPGCAPLGVSAISFGVNQTRANNAVLALGATGQLTANAQMPSGTVHIIVDVNGYFE